MAFSGSKDWGNSVTRDDIIKGALKKCGVYDSADGVPDAELSDAATALNAIVKEWTAEGLALWVRQRVILILNKGFQRYTLGPTGTTGTTDNFHAFVDTQLIENTINATEVAGQTTLSILDNTATTDYWKDFQGKRATKPTTGNIGIRLDSGKILWSTITGVGADTVTIAGAGIPTGEQASAGRKVYTYVTRVTKPMRVTYAYRQDTSGNSAEVSLIGRQEFERLSSKASAGDPVSLHFYPSLTDSTTVASNNAHLMVWPVGNSISLDKLVMICDFYLDDLDAASNNPQFPQEWANALIWNLAGELSFEYGVDPTTRSQILQIAAVKKQVAFAGDVENASAIFVMGRQ